MFLVLAWLVGALFPGAAFLAGHGPMPIIETGNFTKEESMAHRREALLASFYSLDVVGRLEQNGRDNPRKRRMTPEHSRRIPVPNANACISCHYLPYASRGGDNAANVFLLSDFLLFVNFDGDPIENGPNNSSP